MTYAPHVLACVGLVLAAGCKGCDDGSGTPPPAAQRREEQTKRSQLLARAAMRKVDHDKVYPRTDDGSVACGADADCFMVQAQQCAPAVLTHVRHVSAFGIEQSVEATYRIMGKQAAGCKIDRQVVKLGVELTPELTAMLRKRGKTEEDLQAMRDRAVASLRRAHLPHVECFFASDRALEASLDLAEGLRHDRKLWRDSCRELDAPDPEVVWEVAPMQAPPEGEPAAAEQAAAGAQKAGHERGPGREPEGEPGAAAGPKPD